jgi:uncharacterized protein (TIGR02145 family)
MSKSTKAMYLLIVMIGLLFMFTNGCKKDKSESSPPETIKKVPVITWANPASIRYGTLLSAAQLNATADVPGIFVYTPSYGKKLNVGADQNLKVVFTPIDTAVYNSSSKVVKITVTPMPTISSILFNPNLTYGTVTDIDGNVYKTITIGTQKWMAENLRTTRFRNGDSIPKVTGYTAWRNLLTSAYCNYNNTNNNDTITVYGRLYNGYVVTDVRNVAPTGWHVASDAEWITLTNFLGGWEVAGGKMKETDTIHWLNPNEYATNESGFTAIPSGYRSYITTTEDAGYRDSWWSSTEFNTSDVWIQDVVCSAGFIYRDHFPKNNGFSIRCVKD